MKLISDIINELVDSEKSINSPLLKTKVLASRLQNLQLLEWVSNELKGYESEKNFPEYRIFYGNITGTYLNGNMQYSNQPVPTIGLEKSFDNSLRSVRFTQSISSLENFIKLDESGMLEYTFPAEITALIEQNWRKMGNPYLQLINCRRTISIHSMNEILSVVRNNLLDFMLKIDIEFGNLTEIEELKTKYKEIANIMNHTIINASGDGNIVNTGANAKVNSSTNITKNNKEELQKHLVENGVSKEETDELLKIIDSEQPNSETKTFGEKVNNWTSKVLGKVLDGSWNIGIGTAGTVLTEAIKKYYGL